MISLSFACRVSPSGKGEEPSSDTTNVHFDEKDGEMISKFQKLRSKCLSRACLVRNSRAAHYITCGFQSIKQNSYQTDVKFATNSVYKTFQNSHNLYHINMFDIRISHEKYIFDMKFRVVFFFFVFGF